MHARTILISILMLAVGLAGCTGDGDGVDAQGSGTQALRLTVHDDAPGAVTIRLAGAFVQQADAAAQADAAGSLQNASAEDAVEAAAGDATWRTLLQDETLELTGSGENLTLEGEVARGEYQRIRLLFEAVESDGEAAVLVRDGMEFPIEFVLGAKPLELRLSFLWVEALFASTQGPAFDPVLKGFEVLEDDASLLRLGADEIAAGTGGKPPVARIRAFDATGLEVYQSDFVAEDPEDPVIANAGDLTFSAEPSEVLQQGETFEDYTWNLGDGATKRGHTVHHSYPVDGGFYTVQLTVTDSAGGSDSHEVEIVMKPGTMTNVTTMAGEITGAYVRDVEGESVVTEPVEHLVPVDAESFDGAPARLVGVVVTLQLNTSSLPVGNDLDLEVDDADGNPVGRGTTTNQADERVEKDYSDRDAPSGNWSVRVVPKQALESEYTVTVKLTYQGVNPKVERFLADFDDGHDHQH